MSGSNPITFVVCVNAPETFENNFMVSPCFSQDHGHQILAQKDFSSAPKAYNDAIDRSANDLIVFAHQDIIFPERWLDDLRRSLYELERIDPDWGVLGCLGRTPDGDTYGQVYSGGLGIIGPEITHPEAVQTLDEIVLIIRKSSGLRFDERLQHFHFYGAEICLAAAKRGMKSYAIPAFCIHNTKISYVLPREFYSAYWELKRIAKDHLPIQTTCIRMTKFDIPLYQRRITEVYLRCFRRKKVVALRLKDGRELLRQF